MIKLFFAVKILLEGESIAVHLSCFPFACFSSNFPLQKHYILRKKGRRSVENFC